MPRLLRGLTGAGEGIRTPDLRITSALPESLRRAGKSPVVAGVPSEAAFSVYGVPYGSRGGSRISRVVR